MNAFFGIEADEPDGEVVGLQLYWILCESVCLVIFSVELVLRLWAERTRFVRDAWNLFDFILVTTEIADT